jgi:hypothetical protein
MYHYLAFLCLFQLYSLLFLSNPTSTATFQVSASLQSQPTLWKMATSLDYQIPIAYDLSRISQFLSFYEVQNLNWRQFLNSSTSP